MRPRLPPDLLPAVRFFWAIIIGLLVAAGVLLVRPTDRTGDAGPTAGSTTPPAPVYPIGCVTISTPFNSPA